MFLNLQQFRLQELCDFLEKEHPDMQPLFFNGLAKFLRDKTHGKKLVDCMMPKNKHAINRRRL